MQTSRFHPPFLWLHNWYSTCRSHRPESLDAFTDTIVQCTHSLASLSRCATRRPTFRTEQEQRSDLGKGETVLHESDGLMGSSLYAPYFDIHYNAREDGDLGGKQSEWIRYALVVTVEAKKHLDLYEKILVNHTQLRALEAKISLPLSLGA